MDVERALISKCVRTQAMELAVARGIEPEHFITKAIGDGTTMIPATAEVWEWLIGHLRHYRSVPSHELFVRRWPTFPFLEVTDALEAVIDEFVRVVKRRKLIDQIRHLSGVADDWALVGEAEIHLFEAATEMSRVVPTSSVVRFSDSLSRRDRWLRLRQEKDDTGKTPGVSLFFQELDDMTYGVQPGELTILEGFLGRGKSTMTVIQAAHNYLEKDMTPMIMSLDAADADKLANRWDAYMARISYSMLKRLQLEEGDLERWEKIGEKASESRFEKDILVIDDLWRPSVERVYAEIERWRADYTVVDTIDELRAPAQYKVLHEQQSWAARELRSVARHTKKPIVAVAQSGRDAEEQGATLGNIAGSIDIARKADIVIGLHASEDMMKQHMMELRMLKNRDDAGTGWRGKFYWNPANAEFRTWRPEDGMPVRTPAPA